MSEYSIANPRMCGCGGHAVVEEDKLLPGHYFASCSRCGVKTIGIYAEITTALEAWNLDKIDYSIYRPAEKQEQQFHNSHYLGGVQPIELMQEQFTVEEFRGYLKGNIIKYASRLGKKDDPKKEADKILNYANWLHEHTYKGEITVEKQEGE